MSLVLGALERVELGRSWQDPLLDIGMTGNAKMAKKALGVGESSCAENRAQHLRVVLSIRHSKNSDTQALRVMLQRMTAAQGLSLLDELQVVLPPRP